MRLLLDTHVWLWGLQDAKELGKTARVELENPRNELWLSPISVWEAILLGERGRVMMKPDPYSWVKEALGSVSLQEASLNHHVALWSRRLKIKQDDPADRFLAATAMVYDLTLVTADKTLLKCAEIRTLSATK